MNMGFYRKKVLTGVTVLVLVEMLSGCLPDRAVPTEPDLPSTQTTEQNTDAIADAIADAVAQAESYSAQGNYDEAIAVLQTAQQLYGENSQLTLAQTQLQKEKGIYLLEQLEAEESFEQAITYIDKNMQAFLSDAQILTKRNLYVEKYRAQVLEDAEAAFQDTGYPEAITMLNDSLQILPEDAQIKMALAKYEAYIPVSISGLEYFSGTEFAVESNVKDNLGNVHNNVTSPQPQGWSNAATTNVYKLNKQYSRLTGLWFQRYDFRSAILYGAAATNYTGTLEISADGKVIFSGKMAVGVEPVLLDLDISGVTELTIYYFGGGSDGSYSGIADFNVQK